MPTVCRGVLPSLSSECHELLPVFAPDGRLELGSSTPQKLRAHPLAACGRSRGQGPAPRASIYPLALPSAIPICVCNLHGPQLTWARMPILHMPKSTLVACEVNPSSSYLNRRCNSPIWLDKLPRVASRFAPRSPQASRVASRFAARQL
jgi:hypothetical protein